jgi:tetratricopeptide (TPR) repeat protein
MRNIKTHVSLALVGAFLAACGGGTPEASAPVNTAPPVSASGEAISRKTSDLYKDALEELYAHDRANDWSSGNCRSVARAFDKANAEQGGKLSEAVFNAGLALQRCGETAEAMQRFNEALALNPKAHYARVQVALDTYKKTGGIDVVITELDRAVKDAQFQNVAALTQLATFQMQRGAENATGECKSDRECAKKNLQRALAIDDGYMPALNQLALYYYGEAKSKGSAKKAAPAGKGAPAAPAAASTAKKANAQTLELAALVCQQAIAKNPRYAPILNTTGLIQVELGQINGAVQSFDAASNLDPKFFEAHMNLGAVNLSFRGFKKAEAAYRKAVALQPQSYEAHLGLALAVRGSIDDVNFDQSVATVQSELDECKRIDGARPDAYYNEGILWQEYKAKSGGKDSIPSLRKAQAIFNDFAAKASGKSEYADAVKRAKERSEDIDGIVAFFEMDANPPAPAPEAAPEAAAPAPAAPAASPAENPSSTESPAAPGNAN